MALRGAAMLALLAVGRSEGTLDEQWASFRARHGVRYGSAAEESRRFAIFAANAARVAELNADPTDHAEYELGKFADRAPDEVPRSPTTAERKKSPNECTDPQGCVWGGSCYSCSRFPDFATAIPDHIDWTELGAVTPVHTAGLPTPLARRHPSPLHIPRALTLPPAPHHHRPHPHTTETPAA